MLTKTKLYDPEQIINLRNLLPTFTKTISHATTNLLYMGGYLRDGKPDRYTIIDLILQVQMFIGIERIKYGHMDKSYTTTIKTPRGPMEVIIKQNETWKYTVMLPECD